MTPPPILRSAGWWALAALLALIVLVGVWPSRIDGDAGWVQGVLSDWHRSGLPEWIGYDFIERASNFLLYVPLGAGLLLFSGARRWRRALAIAVGISAVIEFAQLILVARVPSVLDVIMNAMGALVGIAIAIVAGELARRREERDRRHPEISSPDRQAERESGDRVGDPL